jgi:hypothetical protein
MSEKHVKLGMYLAYQGNARVLLRSAVRCTNSYTKDCLIDHARRVHDLSSGVLASLEQLFMSTDGSDPPED